MYIDGLILCFKKERDYITKDIYSVLKNRLAS